MKVFANVSIYILSIFSLSWALPYAYDFVFSKEVSKTALFYSPIDKIMVYTEQLRIDDEKAREKSENHHADVVYKDALGNYFTREEFEAKIPFIYFRNMEMRGLLPLEIDGQSFDRAQIEAHRRVLEIPAYAMLDKSHEYEIYPLLESNPSQVALVLPPNRFRMTNNSMEFIDSDINKIDSEMTALYTEALIENNFAFPAKKVWGNYTIFKPYDAGVFVLDSKDEVYHVLRVNAKPKIEKVIFKEKIVPQKILITETQDRKFYGLVVDIQDKVYLMQVDDYALTQIPSAHYNAKTMDYKVLLDPLYLTAIYSDNTRIYAEAYSYDVDNLESVLKLENSFDMLMSRTQSPLYSEISKVIFPFSIQLESENSLKAVLSIDFSDYYYNYALILSFLLALFYNIYYKRNGYSISRVETVSILLFGLYVFIPLLCMEAFRKR